MRSPIAFAAVFVVCACDPTDPELAPTTARLWGQMGPGAEFDVTPEVEETDDQLILKSQVPGSEGKMIVLFVPDTGLVPGHHEIDYNAGTETQAVGCWSPRDDEVWSWDEFAESGGYTMEDGRIDIALEWRDGSVVQGYVIR